MLSEADFRVGENKSGWNNLYRWQHVRVREKKHLRRCSILRAYEFELLLG
jgi:hypothetical protein